MDVIPDPVQVDGRINAVVLKEGHGNAGNGGGFHVRKGAFEHGQATDSDDGLDLSRLNEAHDDGGAFSDQDGVTEAFGLMLQVLDRAKPALLAEQSKLIEGGGTFGFYPQAFWEEKQSAFERHAGQRFPPHFVAEQHANVVPVDGVALKQLQ